jgi:hypothetical protein
MKIIPDAPSAISLGARKAYWMNPCFAVIEQQISIDGKGFSSMRAVYDILAESREEAYVATCGRMQAAATHNHLDLEQQDLIDTLTQIATSLRVCLQTPAIFNIQSATCEEAKLADVLAQGVDRVRMYPNKILRKDVIEDVQFRVHTDLQQHGPHLIWRSGSHPAFLIKRIWGTIVDSVPELSPAQREAWKSKFQEYPDESQCGNPHRFGNRSRTKT